MATIQELVARLIAAADQVDNQSEAVLNAAEQAAVTLGTRGEEAFYALAALLHHPAPERRWWAVRTCAEFDLLAAGQALAAALKDPDLSVQQCAALGLSCNPLPQAVPALIAALKSPDSLLARLAANALVAIGTPAVEPLLEVLAFSPDPSRIEAGRALALIQDPRTVPTLYKLLEDDSILLNYWAEEGLERMGIGMTFFNP